MIQVLAPEVEKLRDEAEKAGWSRCIEGEAVFYLPNDQALLPGHIYSEDGIREFKISGCCEYHFDDWFGDDE